MKFRIFALFFVFLLLVGCGKTTAEGDLTCHITIDCADVLKHPEKCSAEKAEILPENGIFLEKDVAFAEGETAYAVLIRSLQKEKLQYEKDATNYIFAVGGLYSGDCGELSGWLYTINGESPTVGLADYVLKDGDSLQFYFVTDFMAQF